jgi:hypothetical protein
MKKNLPKAELDFRGLSPRLIGIIRRLIRAELEAMEKKPKTFLETIKTK